MKNFNNLKIFYENIFMKNSHIRYSDFLGTNFYLTKAKVKRHGSGGD